MGLARDAFRTVMLAASAGLVVGGVFGVMAPSFAEAGPAAAAAAPPAVRVTSLDLLGTDRLELTLRFSNPGRTVEHIDAADLGVTADGTPLRIRTAGTLDVRPGGTAEETLTFDAPSPTAALRLTLPDGTTLTLG